MGRCIAHVDMDAFYVSVELSRRPELRGKPVVVAGSGARAVVTTASYEARKFGVFSATPAAWARRRCPDAVFITPDFDHYRARSREVMAVLKEHVHRVEIVGLDEAYMDLSGIDRPTSSFLPCSDSIGIAVGRSTRTRMVASAVAPMSAASARLRKASRATGPARPWTP